MAFRFTSWNKKWGDWKAFNVSPREKLMAHDFFSSSRNFCSTFPRSKISWQGCFALENFSTLIVILGMKSAIWVCGTWKENKHCISSRLRPSWITWRLMLSLVLRLYPNFIYTFAYAFSMSARAGSCHRLFLRNSRMKLSLCALFRPYMLSRHYVERLISRLESIVVHRIHLARI